MPIRTDLSTRPLLATILAFSSGLVGLWSLVMATASNPGPLSAVLPRTPLESPTQATLSSLPLRNATQAVLPLNSQSILVAFIALSTSMKPAQLSQHQSPLHAVLPLNLQSILVAFIASSTSVKPAQLSRKLRPRVPGGQASGLPRIPNSMDSSRFQGCHRLHIM